MSDIGDPGVHLELAGWTLRPDRRRTRDFYEALPTLTCTCAHCRNLIAAWDLIPSDARRVFDLLGIDLTKEGGESYAFTASRAGGVHYGGSMLALGDLVAEPTLAPEHFPGGESSSPHSPFAENLDGYFTPDDSLVALYIPSPPLPHFVLQFTLDKVPWVLEEDP